MLKVLLLIPTLDRSGAEKQLTLLATGLPKEEFDVHVVCLTRGGPYQHLLADAGVRCTVIGKRFKFDPFALLRLRKLIRQEAPDIVHSWLFAANSYLRMIAGKKDRPRVIVSERCVDTWKSGWQRRLDRRQIKRTHLLVANSESVADFYKDLGYPDDRVVVIPNGVESPVTNHQSPEGDTTDNREKLLTVLNIPADHHIVGYVGRIAKQKRVPDLIWALQLLQQLRDRTSFVVVGDGPERQKSLDLAKHMKCDHLVRFVGHREDASRFFGLFDVFWLASDFEGMSNSLMEAMAAGVPVVAGDIPPNRELIDHGKTGYLVPVGDSKAFAQHADRLLADDELRRKISDTARERMRAEFSVERMVERYGEVYRRVVTVES